MYSSIHWDTWVPARRALLAVRDDIRIRANGGNAFSKVIDRNIDLRVCFQASQEGIEGMSLLGGSRHTGARWPHRAILRFQAANLVG
jgi:hypothetical protein